MIGISIREDIGVGDKLQYSSLPENYFRTTGEKLIDVSRPWFFDFNPFVVRDVVSDKTVELWTFGMEKVKAEKPRPHCYLSNAESHACVLDAKVFLNRPRLYRYENVKFEDRDKILLHVRGKSHGDLPKFVIDHVLQKYKNVYQIGLESEPSVGIPRIVTKNLWDLAYVISSAKMLIGPDSGPSWVAACYSDIIVKKVRTKWQEGFCEPKDWVPLEIEHYHSHWDDRMFQIFNTSEDDIGFTQSYRKI